MKAVTSFWSALSRATVSEATVFEASVPSFIAVILLVRFFKLQSSREQDIVFEVNVLVHIALQVTQSLV